MRQALIAAILLCQNLSESFFSPVPRRSTSIYSLWGAPKRLADNVEGVLYVNDRCIDCSTCSHFAPTVFERKQGHHVVHSQPKTEEDLMNARAALSACPVAAIRVESTAERQHRGDSPLSEDDKELAKNLAISPKTNGRKLPFPRLLVDNVWYLGHHNERSFGATPYLTSTTSEAGENVWIMIDTPRFSRSAVEAVMSLTGERGPQYLLLTHVDDSADHGKWKERFPDLKRIFHSGDLGRHNWVGDRSLEEVEVLLRGVSGSDLKAFDLDGNEITKGEQESREVVVYHTPGHSPGSISLLHKGSHVLFTGDTLGFTTPKNTLTGFPRYGNNLGVQADTLEMLEKLDWELVAPGHGHARDYRNAAESRKQEIDQAKDELMVYSRR